MANISNIIPSTDPFLGRADELNELMSLVEVQRKAGKLPLICVEGLPLVGKSVLVGELAKRLGKPVWVGVSHGSFENTVSIIGHIGLVLESVYSDQTILNLLSANYKSGLPDAVVFPNVANIAAVLNTKEYVLCIDNFHKIHEDGDISFLLNQIQRLSESTDDRKLRAIILTSETITSLEGISGYELLGFSKPEFTKNMVEANGFSLPANQLALLHEKTEGYPGLVQLFLNYMSTLDQEKIQRALIDLFAQLEKLHEIDQVKRLFLKRIDENVDEGDREALATLAVLKQPFKSEIGVAVLENSGVKQAENRISQLWKKLFINSGPSKATLAGAYYLHSLLRDHFGGNRNSKARKDNNRSAAAVFMSNKDYVSAAYHYQEAGMAKEAAELFTEAPYREYIYELGLTQVIDVLERFRASDFGHDTNTWVDLCTILGDAYELTSQYGQAFEVYQQGLDACEERLCAWKLLRRIGWIKTRQANWDEAIKVYTDGITEILLTHEGERMPEKVETELSRFRSQLGHVHYMLLDYPKAIEFCSQGLKYFEESLPKVADEEKRRVREYCGQANQYLGLAYLGSGQYALAENCFNRALEHYRFGGNQYPECQILLYLGTVHAYSGSDKQTAFADFEDALKKGEKFNSPALRAEYHWRRGLLYSNTGSFRDAESEYSIALQDYISIEDKYHSGIIHNSIANMMSVQGKLLDAKSNWEQARNYFDGTGADKTKIAIIGNLAYLKKLEGDFDGARADWKWAQKETRKIQSDIWEMNFKLNLLELDLYVNGRKDLKKRIEEAKNQTLTLKYEREHTQAIYIEALSFLDSGNFSDALNILNHICNLENTINYEDSLRSYFTRPEVYLLLGDLKRAIDSFAQAVLFTQEWEHFPHIRGRLLRVKGLISLFQKDLIATDELDESASIFNDMGAQLYGAGTYFKAARLLNAYGNSKAADKFIEKCLPFFIKSGSLERVRIIREMQE